MLLRDFIVARRKELIAVGLSRLERYHPDIPEHRFAEELGHFIDGVLRALAADLTEAPDTYALVAPAGQRVGEACARLGLAVGVLARQMGSLSDAVGALTSEENLSFTAPEYHVLDACTDNGVAAAIEAYEAVTSGGRARAQVARDVLLAHEIDHALGTATVAFNILRRGIVGVGSSTGDVLARNLSRLRALFQRAQYVARGGAGAPLVVTRQSVARLVHAVVGELAVHGAHDFAVSISEEVSFDVDPVLMHAALTNLLRSAAKHSSAGTPVAVRAQATADAVVLTVDDSCGAGTAQVEQALAGQLAEGRAGLGLAIVREAVEAHGGSVTVESRPGGGCRFRLTVPHRAADGG